MKKPSQQVRFIIGAILLLGAALAAIVQQGFVVAAPPADAASGGAAAQSKPGTAPPTIGSEADEKAIRATADEFVKAFDAGDAKAVGALWATDAEYTDESGQSYHGRAAIEKEYADLFKEHRGATMTVTIESIRFLGPDIAMEKGIAKVKLPAANADMGSRYTVVHARRDGKWIMVAGRDAPYVPGSNDDYLKDLEWLIGDWTVAAKDRPLVIHFEWMAQRNFIKNTYIVNERRQVHVDRRPDHRLGSQVGTHRLLALRRRGRLRPRRVDQGRLEVGHRGDRRVSQRERKRRGQRGDAHRRQQLHLAVAETHPRRGGASRYGAGQDGESAGRPSEVRFPEIVR